jgi:hypothetical protein
MCVCVCVCVCVYVCIYIRGMYIRGLLIYICMRINYVYIYNIIYIIYILPVYSCDASEARYVARDDILVYAPAN